MVYRMKAHSVGVSAENCHEVKLISHYPTDKVGVKGKWMLPPTDLGVIKLVIIPNRGDIHVSL
jgi:hypothetical protein